MGGVIKELLQKQKMPQLRVADILNQHADKEFVQRILRPDTSPVYDFGDGRTGTHLMAWSSLGDQNIVYPMLVNQGGNLQLLDDYGALTHALQTGEYIPFPTPQMADWFGKNYKSVWGDTRFKDVYPGD